MHIRSGLCVHPKGGRPSEGVPLVYYEGCDQPRLKLDLYQLKGNAKTLLCRQRCSSKLHRLKSILPRSTILKTCMGLEFYFKKNNLIKFREILQLCPALSSLPDPGYDPHTFT